MYWDDEIPKLHEECQQSQPQKTVRLKQNRLRFHGKDDQGDGPLTLRFKRELHWNRVTTVRNHNTDAHIEIDLADSLFRTWLDLENCC